MTVTPTISKSVSLAEESYQNSATIKVPQFDANKEAPQNSSFFSRFTNVIGIFRLELTAFLLTFSYVLPRITSTSMILEKVCLAHFKYPQDVCESLEYHSELKPAIERLATNYQLGHTLIQTAPAALLACFVGPWSDNYGRKFPVLLALSGLALDSIGSAVAAHYLNSRVEYYYIPALFSGLSGGVVCLLAVVYSYASDLTPFHKRTMKYATLEISSGLAIPLGAASGGWIYNFLGYPAVYLLSTGGVVATILCVLFLLPETRGMDRKETWREKICELFSCKTFMESFIATAKKRPFKGRRQIVLLIISMCFIVISTNSTSDINFLYVHHQFNWGNTEYSTITAMYSVIALVLLVIILPLLKKIKASDAQLGLIGTTSLLIKFIGMGLSFKEIVFHAANLLGLLSACAPLAARSRISKVVSNDDIGKVFSFVATAESLLPVMTTVLISQIFNAFLEIFPGMAYIVLAIFLVIPFSVFIWLTCLPNLSYEEIHGNNEQNREICVKVDA
nr:solute carrier family 46 member 3 isoform X2 [Parasteatoda tepidariorum]XP_042895375.1 solute carrier family 46 member 3 isoform X3 [Parasteatoda tepidariorum]XP_042895378.1 solute carrier family 46 member 3 isoform X2 [Parasteatoda tepidariorum]XP_042895379.1 solute carrier family 46 member 3 isoform X2 [Parasteatoda tepidariorum]